MSAHIQSTIPWRPPFLREKKRYINTSSSNCHHVVLQEHRPSPGNILCHAGSPPCLWCLLEGFYATPSLGNPSLPHWRTHSSWLLLLLCGEFQITVTPTKLNPAHASYINWMYLILIYVSYKFADSSQAVSKPVWHISLLYVQWKTPDDGQWNCPKHLELYSKNIFWKLVHLVGFIIRIYHNARSPEHQNI